MSKRVSYSLLTSSDSRCSAASSPFRPDDHLRVYFFFLNSLSFWLLFIAALFVEASTKSTDSAEYRFAYSASQWIDCGVLEVFFRAWRTCAYILLTLFCSFVFVAGQIRDSMRLQTLFIALSWISFTRGFVPLFAIIITVIVIAVFVAMVHFAFN